MPTFNCKDCGDPFEVPDDEMWKYQHRIGLVQHVPPVRCLKCRGIHRKAVQNLGRVTIGIANAQSGEGCYLPLTREVAQEVNGWDTSLDWEFFVSENTPDQTDAVVFNIDQETYAAMYFVDSQQGLIVYGIVYSPWIDNYSDAGKAIPLYLIAESIRRGYGGGFRIAYFPDADTRFYNDWGMQQDGFEYVMDGISAAAFSLEYEGVLHEIVAELVEQDRFGRADIAWICQKVAQKKLSPEMVEEVTKAKSGIRWSILQNYVENGNAIQIGQRKDLMRKLQGLFGQLETLEYLKSVDPSGDFETEAIVASQSVDILVKFGIGVDIDHVVAIEDASGNLVPITLGFSDYAECAIECKTWKRSSFRYKGNIDILVREIDQARSEIGPVLVFVTSDFLTLDSPTIRQIVEDVEAAGGSLVVHENFKAAYALSEAKRFLSFLQ